MGYTPKNPKIVRECPFKFSVPENGIECTKEKCAFWLTLQKRCAILGIAEYFAFSNEIRRQKLKEGEK
jgi:hypothetical protein